MLETKRQPPFLKEVLMNDIFIYGASGHGSIVLDAARGAGFEIKGFVDNNEELSFFENLPVKHELSPTDTYIIAIGDNAIRQHLVSIHANTPISCIIHHSATVNSNVILGIGSVICPGVVINANAVIGNHCIVNTSSVIEHDCIIKDFAHVSPNATLCGGVTVGEGTHIGAAAVIIPGVLIGAWCIIGAGAVVIHDVPDGATVVGNPGRIIKR